MKEKHLNLLLSLTEQVRAHEVRADILEDYLNNVEDYRLSKQEIASIMGITLKEQLCQESES